MGYTVMWPVIKLNIDPYPYGGNFKAIIISLLRMMVKNTP